MAAPDTGAIPEPVDPQAAAQAVIAQLETRLRNGGGWFLWIAGLSIVNSIVSLSGSQWSFIIGLGITQIIDAVAGKAAEQGATIAKIVAFGFDLLAAGMFALFGVYARKKSRSVFIVGMILYALDGLLFVLVRDWLSIGFHAFALYGVYGGYKACVVLNALEREAALRAGAAGATFG